MNRRTFLAMAASLGASLAWRSASASSSRVAWKERRDIFPHGVASGDPHSDSVILWTRRPPAADSEAKTLTLEVAEDSRFQRVIAATKTTVSADSDWTCRVLAAGLKPRTVYWYRFTDEFGFGSRVGRTITTPAETDARPVHFTFVSCQNVQMGASTAYRCMKWEDEKKALEDQLSFVLHLGDFVYEIIWYPEDRPQGMYSRRLRDIVHYKNGEKHEDLHVPTTLEDYRALYKAYLLDPDLQDARAHWPFVCLWDNHEFSWKGWQTQESFGQGVVPAQTRKVAAMQTWFEYQPARVVRIMGQQVERYEAPRVTDAAIEKFDDHGLGMEAGNLTAIESLKISRTLRIGKNVELILTDNRTFRSESLTDRPEMAPFKTKDFPYFESQEVIEIFDAGRAYNESKPPETIAFGGKNLPNARKNMPPQSMLGAKQKEWFLAKLRESKAPWKLWGNTVGMLDWRTDFQNLPEGLRPKWPATGYAQLGDDDWAGYRHERSEILDFVRRENISGFATLAGDRHSFQAGVLSPSLPPHKFEPVGVEFVTGSISAPGICESLEYNLAKDHPLRAAFLYQPAGETRLLPALNFSVMYGVRASLALQKTGDIQQALKERNNDVSPHLSFVDGGGHGYAVVTAKTDEIEVEFVCIPRPLERSESPDGGPLAYRVAHRAKLWQPGTAPKLERTKVEGPLPLIV